MENHNIEICPNCGAELKYSQILKKKVCKYCGLGEDEKNFKEYINSAVDNNWRIQLEKEKTKRFNEIMLTIATMISFLAMTIILIAMIKAMIS